MSEPKPEQISYEELLQQNQALRQEIHQIKAEMQAIWMMLAGTNRRLQMSSAAIKAAVSSLLNYDIFWDGANQHEFLETINTSVDQAGRLGKLLTLAFRLEAGNLVLKREPQVLQEIVSAVQNNITARFPHLALEMTLPHGGQPAVVDYDFLVIALEYLIEVLEGMGVRQIGIQAVEESDDWALQFGPLNAAQVQTIQSVIEPHLEPKVFSNSIAPEHLLRLFVAFQILALQEIKIELPDRGAHLATLRFVVPAQ